MPRRGITRLSSLAFKAALSALLFASSFSAGDAQPLPDRPILYKTINVAQGETTECDLAIHFLFWIPPREYVTFPEDVSQQLATGPEINAPDGVEVKLLSASVSKKKVDAKLQFGETLSGEGYEIRSKISVLALNGVPLGKHRVSVTFPMVGAIAKIRKATLGYSHLVPAAKEARYELQIEVFATSPERDAAEQTAREVAERPEKERIAKEQHDQLINRVVLFGSIGITALALAFFLFVCLRQARSGEVLIHEEDRLPGLCMCCGKPSTDRYIHGFSWSPWRGSGLIGALVLIATTQSVSIAMPLCEQHQPYWRNRRLLLFIAIMLPLALWLLPLFLAISAMTMTTFAVNGGCAFLLLVCLLLLAEKTVIRAAEINDHVVLLKGVNEQFAEAVRSQTPEERHGDDSETNESFELKMALRKALSLEQRGQWAEALKQWEVVIKLAGDHPNSGLAKEHMRQIQERLDAEGPGLTSRCT